MKIPALLTVLLLGSLLAVARAAEPAPEALAASTKLLGAITAGDYAAFVADGDAAFKQLPQAAFASVAAQLGPKFKAGVTPTYLGDLKQKGFDVTLWRLRFADGSDDALATLSLKNGKVGGYWIK
ncbi:MAG: hypothetical protein SFU85_04245 [Candidatus Methylacidiphilales bacterium]|nr:hypothetical protein [Candidatus Methylacidiphilales bacterium]